MLLALLAAGVMLPPAQGSQDQERERERERLDKGVQWHLADKSIVTIREFGMQLRSLDVNALRRSKTDLLVVDPYAGKPLSAAQVRRIQRGPDGRRVVLAYVRISEIDPRSPIWNRKWDANKDGRPDAAAPAWLGSRQADGDYTVRYWLPAWDAPLFQGRDSLVQRLIRTGYDGMVLDLGNGLANKEIKPFDAEQKMGKLLMRTTSAARGVKRRFFSVVMNPSNMIKFGDLLLMHDGVLAEGFFYGHEQPNKRSSEEFLDKYEETLEELAEEGRLILTVAYTTDRAQIRENEREARRRGMVPFSTVRTLDRLPNQ